MKKSISWLLFVTISSCCFIVRAENLITESETSERAKLAQERGKVESEYKSKEIDCYKKFAVDSCLKNAHAEKRAALAEIRRKELAMNDLQRQKKKAEFDLKMSKPVVPNQATTGDDKLNRLSKPSYDDGKQADATKKRAQETRQKMMTSQAKAARRVQKTKLADEKAVKYQKKLLKADEHKAATEQEMTSSTKPKASSLPIPKSFGN